MSVGNASVQQSASPPQGLLARHSLISFFVMAYAFSWIVWSPWVLSEEGVGLLPFRLGDGTSGLLNAFAILAGPTLSALIMTGITEGKAGIRRLLGRIVLWRVGLRWYLFALIGLPLAMVLATIIVRPGALESFQTLAPLSVLPYLGAFVFMVLIGGPLFEEPGWSGFALPRLQRVHSPLVGGLILGSLWAL